eukprot:scaffold2846_cov231-Alexandrium_tamarense.AAC.15
MKFGERLLSSQHPQWSEYYIDYLRLKQLLYQLFDVEPSASSPRRTKWRDVPEEQQQQGDSVVGGFMDASRADDPASPLHHAMPGSSPPQHYQHGVSHVSGEARRPTTVSSSRAFQQELNYEIQKALFFLLTELGKLASDESELTKLQTVLSVKIDSLPTVDQQLRQIYNLKTEYLVRIGSKLLLLLEFIEINIEAIIKIVKKHDKFISEESTKQLQQQQRQGLRFERLRRQYLPRFAKYSSDPNLRCLFLIAADAGDTTMSNNGSTGTTTNRQQTAQPRRKSQLEGGSFGGWDVLQWNLDRSLRELFEWQQVLKGSCKSDGDQAAIVNSTTKETDVLLKPRSQSISEMQLYVDAFGGEEVQSGIGGRTKSLLSKTKSFFGAAGYEATSPQTPPQATFFEPILYRIQSTRRRLGKTTDRYGSMVYAHEMLHLIDDKSDIQKGDDMTRLRSGSLGGSLMDVEMTQQEWMRGDTEEECKQLLMEESCPANIVAPTSGLYAKLLGFDPASAGLIIGATPLAVIGSSVLYSYWSSFSYKRALLFASSCCILGNLVYALALPCDSLTMVLVGRMLTGFGSARVINRR